MHSRHHRYPLRHRTATQTVPDRAVTTPLNTYRTPVSQRSPSPPNAPILPTSGHVIHLRRVQGRVEALWCASVCGVRSSDCGLGPASSEREPEQHHVGELQARRNEERQIESSRVNEPSPDARTDG